MHGRFAGVGGTLGRGDLYVNEWDSARVIQIHAVNTNWLGHFYCTYNEISGVS